MGERSAEPGGDAATVLAYHEATKHSERSVREGRHVLDWANQPRPFKIPRGLERLPLPEPPTQEVPALQAIAEDPAAPPPEQERVPDLAALARVLFLAAGVTKRRRHPGGEVLFRAHPNTGALHHVDLYLVTAELPELPAGVYHFGPHDFTLRRIRTGDWRATVVETAGGSCALAHAPAIVASASTWWRNSWKYQARAWRHVFWDGGALHANLLAAAAGEGLAPQLVLGFADAPLERLLALDPQREGLVALTALGRLDAPPPLPPMAEPPALEVETEPLSPQEVDEPAIRTAQLASALASGEEVAAWRRRAEGEPGPGAPAPEKSVGPLFPLRSLPEAELPREPLDRVIRRRGSTRAFDPEASLSFAELSTALDRATRGIPADFAQPPGSTLLDLYLIVHAVEGLPPGAYRLRRDEGALELLREGPFRRDAARLALGQPLAGHAAANVYCLAALGRVLARLGARGYRAAQLEGGLTGGRLYLAAYAQRFGATGLTFFDDDAIRFFAPHAEGMSVMFLTALGRADRKALGLA